MIWLDGLPKVTISAGNLGPFHTTPKKFENEAFYARPTLHTNPSRKWSFSKTLLKREEFENASFAFQCGMKALWLLCPSRFS